MQPCSLALNSLRALWLMTLLIFAGAAVAAGPAAEKKAAKFEIDYMTGMISHHQMAVHMGTMCVQKAEHEELRAMCDQIIAAQTAEIATLMGWLQAWYGSGVEPKMSGKDQREMEKLEALSGAEFEIEFMKSMIRHHFTAIVVSSECLLDADHPALIAMCQDIITAQAAEIRQLRNWLCEWYGICSYRARSEEIREETRTRRPA